MFYKGMIFSEEHKRKLSESHKGKTLPEEQRMKIGQAQIGRKCSEETKKKISESRKGERHWFYGRKLPEEQKKRMIEALIGHPPWYIAKGEKNVNWKGGITPENEKIRKSLEYKNWRDSVFKRDNWICQWCKTNSNQLIAHHIKPFSQFPELRFDIENGITYCKECHKKIHDIPYFIDNIVKQIAIKNGYKSRDMPILKS